MKATLTIAIALSLTLLGVPPAMAQTGHDLFQQALVKERADGDLRGAIEIYERIAQEFTADRQLAAKALVQLGQCYEKLGSTEAERAYRRVVREFADQNDLVVRAQSRLAALQRAARAAEEVSITTRRVAAGLNVGGHDATPDGKYLVWNDYQGTMNLELREVGTDNRRYLTEDARYSPTWAVAYGGRVSPDGQWVAHGYSEQDEGGSLRVVGMDGANLREFLRQKGCWIQPHQCTSDGSRIAARWDCWPESNPKGTHKIVLIRVADAAMHVLRELPGTRYGLRSWLSPDDRYLVYHGPVEDDDGNFDVWLLPIDGSEEVKLIQHPADDRLLGWVPGSEHIVFLSDRDGTWDLWAARVGDGMIAEPPRKLQRDMGEVDPVGFTDDGSLFYSVFTRWFTTTIASFDPATGAARLDEAKPLLGSNRSPHWSPDGKYLAFVTESAETEGKSGRLNVNDLATGEQREIVPHVRVRFVGDWSPDGRGILILGSDQTQEDPLNRVAIYAIDVTSAEVTPLLPLGERQQARAEWSPDGEAIFYSLVSSDSVPRARVMRLDLASGLTEELYRDSLMIDLPMEVSPDGRQIVIGFADSIDAIGGGGLSILDIENGIARQIVAHGDSVNGEPGSVQWTPDGRYIVYAEMMHGDAWRTLIWRVNAKGGEPEYLWKASEGKYGSWFELSPDGTQIALTTYTQENEVWVMENLREVLARER
jgi:Tol biopolymer transport system component